MHTTISDGKLTPEELIKLAIEKKFDTICLTDHYHFPPGFRDWGNNFYLDKDYDKLFDLKNKYKNKIKILVGVEFDWLKDYKEWITKAAKKKFDYKIISLHFIKAGKEYFPIDYSDKTFQEILEIVGSIEKLVRTYYSELRDAIETGLYDTVGHMDLIKIWNENHKYFTEKEAWYNEEVNKTLKLISKKNMNIDLNSAGFRKPCKEQYPSDWIIKEALKLKIPLIVGTDVHNAEELEAGLKEVSIKSVV